MQNQTVRTAHPQRPWRAIPFLLVAALLAPAARAADAPADPAGALQTLPGFKVDLVLKADKEKNGSWISLSKDHKGRLLLGGQKGQPLTRLTVKDGQVIAQEQLKLPVSEVMGALDAFDSLYLHGTGKDKDGKTVFGLFRCRDAKGDGNYDQAELLREWPHGSGEHGAHAIRLGPDGKHLYVVCGNFVEVPADVKPTSPHRNYADDLVLPRAEDGNGFGAGKKPPGGFVCRMDPDGGNAELFASGERNTYDVAFNADGELFGFDSDMEWDWGTPWYRPIRVFHAPSGADQGFREGTGKWPTYYPDSLPPAVEIGIGCPTGVEFGYGAKFPAKYQKALYVLDWTYGRLIAVHLQPKGASYAATWENFVAPKALHAEQKTPLNLTDAVVGDDGGLYFTIGGRNTAAALFRVTYAGTEPTAAADPHDADGADARALRHKLEAFHTAADPKAVEAAWPSLGSDDRFIRYAARIAVERQPIDQWQARALSESNPQAALTALLAVARLGGSGAQADVLKALAKFPIASFAEQQQLEKLRVIEVSIARHGMPAAELTKPIVAELDAMFPAKDFALNRELSQVLLALNAPDAVAKTVKLMQAAPTQEEQLAYVLSLRTIKEGWTPELRQAYFGWWPKAGAADAPHFEVVRQWFTDAGRPFANGSSFNNFVAHFHADAEGTLAPAEKQSLAAVLDAFKAGPGKKPKAAAKPRAIVKAWTMAEIEPQLASVGKGRNFKRGQEAYEAAQCVLCHKFGNDGGATGPDLTAVSSRFARRDILESILEPSKVVSEQYANTTIKTKDGDAMDGRVLEETADAIVLQPNPLAPEKVTIKKAEVKSRNLSKLSPMPEGLANVLKQDEILDLLAYLESGGNKNHPDFKK